MSTTILSFRQGEIIHNMCIYIYIKVYISLTKDLGSEYMKNTHKAVMKNNLFKVSKKTSTKSSQRCMNECPIST